MNYDESSSVWQVSERRTEYNSLKKINEEEEDKMQAEIKALQMELEDKRLENRSKEGLIEREIAERLNKIQDLKKSIESKEEEFSNSRLEARSFSVSSTSPSAPPQYESLYSCLASSLSQEPEGQQQGIEEVDSASQAPQAWLGSRPNLAKSMESLTPPVPTERKNYSR